MGLICVHMVILGGDGASAVNHCLIMKARKLYFGCIDQLKNKL